jgi:hypothetical protein
MICVLRGLNAVDVDVVTVAGNDVEAQEALRLPCFNKSPTPSYVVLWDLHWHVLECQRLEPAADLSGAMAATIERLEAEGLNQTVRSQRNLTIMLRQSSGKYDCHGWTTERTLPSLAICLANSIASSERYTCGTAKIGTCGEASKFIILLLHGARVSASTGIASCGLFGKPPIPKGKPLNSLSY